MPDRDCIPRGTDRFLIGLIAVLIAQLTFLSYHLIVPDFFSQYPFMGGDSQDWIANGLWFAGFDVRYSVRPPLLPLLIAALHRMGLIHVLPILLLTMSQLIVLPLYLWLRPRYGRPIALMMALTLLTNYSWLRLGLEIMADAPATSLLFAGSWCFVLAVGGRQRWYLAGGFLIGLSAVTQQMALLFLLPAVITLMIHRREHFRKPVLFGATMLGVIPFTVWSIWKMITFGTAGDVMVRQWSLVGFHVDSIGPYLLSAISILGLPAAALSAFGFCLLAINTRRCHDDVFVVGMLIVISGFVVLIYQYQSKRLLVYAVPFALIAAAEGLRRIPNLTLRGAVAILLLLVSMMPLPMATTEYRWAAVWPVPPTYLHALDRKEESSVENLRLKVFGLTSLPGWSVPARVIAATRALPPRRPFDFQAFVDADSAVWIHDGDVNPPDRYQVGLRIGNVLRKRVKHAPLQAVGRHLASLEVVGPTMFFESWNLRRVSFVGMSRSWILVTTRDGPTDRLMATKGGTDVRILPGRGEALRIVDFVRNLPAAVVVEPGATHQSLLYLPFLVPSPDFFVQDRETFERLARAFDAGPLRPAKHSEHVTMSLVEAAGRTWAVIEYH